MVTYDDVLSELKALAEPDYAAFHKRLLKNDKISVLGVRVPQLRKLAKKYKNDIDGLMTFPDEYYEVTFLKLQAVALLPWEEFIKYVNDCVLLIDNWATCDCFAPKCIAKHKDEFMPKIYAYWSTPMEFPQRFALTTLLHFYVEEKYFDDLAKIMEFADTQFYYVHMAAAWLIAEILVKFYNFGVELLQNNVTDAKTHNKAIQKACESYRLTKEQKDFLRGLMR